MGAAHSLCRALRVASARGVQVLALLGGLAMACAAAAQGCTLRIADLSELYEARSADIADWQVRQQRLNDRLTDLRAAVLAAHIRHSGVCTPAVLEGIATLRADVAASARDEGGTDLPGWLTQSRPEIFHCLSDLRVRLVAAQDAAQAEGNRLQVQRLTQISDRLTRLDRNITRMMIEAQTATIKNDRLNEELDVFDLICSEDDF